MTVGGYMIIAAVLIVFFGAIAFFTLFVMSLVLMPLNGSILTEEEEDMRRSLQRQARAEEHCLRQAMLSESVKDKPTGSMDLMRVVPKSLKNKIDEMDLPENVRKLVDRKLCMSWPAFETNIRMIDLDDKVTEEHELVVKTIDYAIKKRLMSVHTAALILAASVGKSWECFADDMAFFAAGDDVRSHDLVEMEATVARDEVVSAEVDRIAAALSERCGAGADQATRVPDELRFESSEDASMAVNMATKSLKTALMHTMKAEAKKMFSA